MLSSRNIMSCARHNFFLKKIGLFLIYHARKKFKHKNLQQQNRKQEKKLTTKPLQYYIVNPKPTTANPGVNSKSVRSHKTVKPRFRGAGFFFSCKANFTRSTKHVVGWKKVKKVGFWELNEVQSPYVVGLNKRNDFCEN